jgi:metal-responsive CopG/Arc/MetJ family transcriptional regulator
MTKSIKTTNTKIINMSLPLPLWLKVDKLAKKEAVPRSEILKRALRQYITSQERWQMIRKWGKQASKRLGVETEEDIERIVDEYREERAL